MLLKSILSKNNLVNLINPAIYIINIIAIIMIFIFVNKNVYQAIVIHGEDLRGMINESPNDINLDEFNGVIEKINSKTGKMQSINVGEIF